MGIGLATVPQGFICMVAQKGCSKQLFSNYHFQIGNFQTSYFQTRFFKTHTDHAQNLIRICTLACMGGDHCHSDPRLSEGGVVSVGGGVLSVGGGVHALSWRGCGRQLEGVRHQVYHIHVHGACRVLCKSKGRVILRGVAFYH
jgi:hypothetical protein